MLASVSGGCEGWPGKPLTRSRIFVSNDREYPVGSGCIAVSGDLGIGRGRADGAEAEQRLEGGHRGPPTVMAKDELVEVDLQMLGGGSPLGALKPSLEVGEGPVSARQDHLALLAAPALGDRAVVEAEPGQAGVTTPAVGMDDRPALDVGDDPGPERALAGIGKDREPNPPRPGAANLDRDSHELLPGPVSAGSAPGVDAADEALVDLDLAPKRGSLGGDHRSAQLLEHEPGGLVATQPGLALKLLGRDPGRVGGDQVGGPEPEAKRGAGAMHDRSRGHRRLMVAASALPEVAALEHPGPLAAAGGAAVAVWPARGRQVLEARRVFREALLELHDRAREVWPAHPTTVGTGPDGTGYSRAAYMAANYAWSSAAATNAALPTSQNAPSTCSQSTTLPSASTVTPTTSNRNPRFAGTRALFSASQARASARSLRRLA